MSSVQVCFLCISVLHVFFVSITKPERHEVFDPEGTQILASRYQTSGLVRHHSRFNFVLTGDSFSGMLHREWPAGLAPAGTSVELCKDVDSLPGACLSSYVRVFWLRPQ